MNLIPMPFQPQWLANQEAHMSSVKPKSALEGAIFVPVDGYAALFQDAPPPTEEDLRRVEQAECAAADAAREWLSAPRATTKISSRQKIA